MANLCSTTLPLGLNQECTEFLTRVDKVIIMTKGNTLTAASMTAKTELVVDIQQSLVASIYSLADYEDTSEDPTIETTGFGKKIITNEPPPSAQVYLEMNPCDFSNLLGGFTGGEYDVIFVGANGYLMYWESGTSAYGFTAKINAVSKGLPPKDNVSQQYRLDIYFTDVGQFKAAKVIQPNYNALTDLLLVVPGGLAMREISNNGTTAVVNVEKRCGAAYTGLALADFEIVSQSGSLSISSVTDNSDGTYDLAITMGAGTFAEIRVKELSGSDVLYVSNNVTLTQ